jgi:hypothetical protein
MGLYSSLKGIFSTTFQLGKAGIKIKNNSSLFEVVAADGTTYVDSKCANSFAVSAVQAGNATNVGSLIAFGDANKVTFAYAAAQAADSIYTWVKPVAGKFLKTDVSGNLSWEDPAATPIPTDHATIASKAFGFGSGASFNQKLLPIGAIVRKVQVIIDTPFDTAATLEIGKAGTTDKYMAATENDLQGLAGDVFEAVKGNAAVSGSSEQVICTFNANSAIAGAGRVLVEYCIPETL